MTTYFVFVLQPTVGLFPGVNAPFVTTQRGTIYPDPTSSTTSSFEDISTIQASIVAQVQHLSSLFERLPDHLRTPIPTHRSTSSDLLNIPSLNGPPIHTPPRQQVQPPMRPPPVTSSMYATKQHYPPTGGACSPPA